MHVDSSEMVSFLFYFLYLFYLWKQAHGAAIAVSHTRLHNVVDHVSKARATTPRKLGMEQSLSTANMLRLQLEDRAVRQRVPLNKEEEEEKQGPINKQEALSLARSSEEKKNEWLLQPIYFFFVPFWGEGRTWAPRRVSV